MWKSHSSPENVYSMVSFLAGWENWHRDRVCPNFERHLVLREVYMYLDNVYSTGYAGPRRHGEDLPNAMPRRPTWRTTLDFRDSLDFSRIPSTLACHRHRCGHLHADSEIPHAISEHPVLQAHTRAKYLFCYCGVMNRVVLLCGQRCGWHSPRVTRLGAIRLRLPCVDPPHLTTTSTPTTAPKDLTHINSTISSTAFDLLQA